MRPGKMSLSWFSVLFGPPGQLILGLLFISPLLLTGCGKSDKDVSANVQVLDASKFRPAFSSAPPETKALVDGIMMSIQGSDYKKALADLEKLAGAPGLTDQQKKVTTALTEQLKKKMAAMPQANP